VTLPEARRLMRDPNVLAPMMVKQGDADAAISGLAHHYPEVIRPALQIHHTAPGTHLVAGVYIMIVNDRPYLFTDTTVNIEPSAEDLAAIACLAADFARRLGMGGGGARGALAHMG
jgi:malate dehydrogenase (oxaloacetate-decarboxylating)(NADP+)